MIAVCVVCGEVFPKKGRSITCGKTCGKIRKLNRDKAAYNPTKRSNQFKERYKDQTFKNKVLSQGRRYKKSCRGRLVCKEYSIKQRKNPDFVEHKRIYNSEYHKKRYLSSDYRNKAIKKRMDNYRRSVESESLKILLSLT